MSVKRFLTLFGRRLSGRCPARCPSQLPSLIEGERTLSYNRAEASERGTLEDVEVRCRGGEQARQDRAGSLKPLQDLKQTPKLSGPASAPVL